MVLQQPELFGPTRYQWDSGYFQQEIERQVETSVKGLSKVKHGHELAFYDYIEITQLKVVYSVLAQWIKATVLPKLG
jgi:hypothetical protein